METGSFMGLKEKIPTSRAGMEIKVYTSGIWILDYGL